uniref:Uncharacterized protein n=1 Tax=Candidatus Kentrum sp. LPFa TaxID=2126335 RepID=A0A450WLQ8_9GAMM|nr:MAG: hypothetical protein BECKLPF1236B_GA0070989_11293 [Candidatus Kentron sp. LPFa]
MNKLLISVAVSCSLAIPLNSNALQGDVHGRDLNISGLGWVGHVGIESANYNILEMLSGTTKESNWGYTSELHKNSKSSFKMSSPYWGAKYWNWLVDNQFWRVYNYIVPNADWVEDVGANYTTTVFYNHPSSYQDSRGNWRIRLAKYRCDTYTESMYNTGGIVFSSSVQLPTTIYNALPDKR